MPGALTHSPADVIRRLIIALDLGTAPLTPGSWPVYVSEEPNLPDNCITVFDTIGIDNGRTMTDGERAEQHGIQIRVRSATHKAGFTKARAIAVTLDSDCYQDTVQCETTSYLVHCVNRVTDVLALGQDSPKTKRSVFTVNANAVIRQL